MKIEIDKKDLKKLNNIDEKVNKALSKAILVVEAKAKENLYGYGDLGDHGEVARSIYSGAEGNEAYVSVASEAGFWYEYGTGSFAEKGNGRPGWWVYIDEDYPHPKSNTRIIYTEAEAKQCAEWLITSGVPADKVHISQGNEARPFLRPALHSSIDSFKKVLAEGIREEIING